MIRYVPAVEAARAFGIKPQSLAAASRRGRGPKGRTLLSPTVAGYPEEELERFAREREAMAAGRLEAARLRAAHARACRAAKRGAA